VPEFTADLCKLCISCNIAWLLLRSQLLLFFLKYVPEAKTSDRRTLSNQVLDSLVIQPEMEMKSKVARKLATDQCDGWRSNAKASISATSVIVEGKVCDKAVFSTSKKSANNLLQIILEDIEYCENEFDIVSS
ncbi:hypothetical protein DFH09DRAFT_912463, partial [Mycena vulgaris]